MSSHDDKNDAEQQNKKKLVLVGSSASLLLLLVVGAVAASNYYEEGSEPSTKSQPMRTTSKSVETICSSTDYTKACETSISKVVEPDTTDPKVLIKAAVTVVLDEVSKGFAHSKLLESNDSQVRGAVHDCQLMYEDSKDDINATLQSIIDNEIEKLPDRSHDMQTWLSAVMAYQQTCIDGFPEGELKTKMKTAMKGSKELTSNALAIIGESAKFLALMVAGRRLLSADDFAPRFLPFTSILNSPFLPATSSPLAGTPSSPPPVATLSSPPAPAPSSPLGTPSSPPAPVPSSPLGAPSFPLGEPSSPPAPAPSSPLGAPRSPPAPAPISPHGATPSSPPAPAPISPLDLAAFPNEQVPSPNAQVPLPNVPGAPDGLPQSPAGFLQAPVPSPGGFPSWMYEEDRQALKSHSVIMLSPNVTIAKDGSGDFTTINEALLAFPSSYVGRYVIYVKAGIYKEQVNITKNMENVTMYGDGGMKSIITGSLNYVDGTRTYHTATFIASGDRFIAIGMGFRNTAGPEKLQAVAVRVHSDRSVFLKCRIHAYQDTLYAHSHRQFYRECVIAGTIDFIFGDASAIFQKCIIVVRRPLDYQANIITAQARSDRQENSGFVIQNCRIRADPLLADPSRQPIKSYLARPWGEFSKTVFMENQIDAFIDPDGYMPWEGTFALNTLYYAEFNNFGGGANTSQRVTWRGVHAIGRKEAALYTVGRFIEGGTWIPESGAPVRLGLASSSA